MIHAVLHDAKDTVAVAVVEGLTAGTELSAWIMDEDRIVHARLAGHPHWPQGRHEGHGRGRHGLQVRRGHRRVVAPIQAGQHAHVHNIKTKRW